MSNHDTYAIRRAIARALHRYYCPQELNTLLYDDAIILLDADPARLKAEWEELTAAGRLIPVEGFPRHRSLAPALRKQLDAGMSLLGDPLFASPSELIS